MDEDFEGLNQEEEHAIEPETPPVEEPPQLQAEPKQDDDFWKRQAHIERSNLGRKVKSLETNMVTKDDLRSFLLEFNQTYGRQRDDEDDYDTIPENPKDLKRFIRNEISRTQPQPTTPPAQQDRYSDRYIDEMNDLMWEIEDQTIRDEVYGLMTKEGSPFNKRISDNPESDCGKNFARALANVTKNKRAEPPPRTFQGKGAPVPAGVTTPQSATQPAKKAPKLDDIASEFARSMGMSEDEILDAMSGDISPGLRIKI